MRNEEYKQFNCYKILVIQSNATREEIQDAWRKMSKVAHSDTGGSDDRQKKINVARDILLNHTDRIRHDIYWGIAHTSNSYKSEGKRKEDNTSHQNTKKNNTKADQSQYRPNRGSAINTIMARMSRAINHAKEKIWSRLESCTEDKLSKLKKQISDAEVKFYIYLFSTVSFGLLSFGGHPIIIVIFIILLIVTWGKAKVDIIPDRYLTFWFMTEEEQLKWAKDKATEERATNANDCDKYIRKLDDLIDILLKKSSLYDGEDFIMTRIIIAVFFMGYMPLYCNSYDRILVFEKNNEKTMIRFRHRDGASVNIGYIEKLYSNMQMYGATKGVLFASSGVSANAKQYANAHNITIHNLDGMNNWIANMLTFNYSGPDGDIFENIDKLYKFIARANYQ